MTGQRKSTMDDCGQCGTLKREIRKQISAFKTLQRLEPNFNPDILIRNLERLVGSEDEEVKTGKRIPLSTIDTGIRMEGESTCEIDGGEMSDTGGEMISIYEVLSPHRRTTNNFSCDMDEEEEMQIEDSGNHTGTISKDEFQANEPAKNNKKRQKPEDEEEQKHESDLLYQQPNTKRLKSSSSCTSSNQASVIVRTPLDFPLTQQHQKNKNPLKIKLRPKSNNNINNNDNYDGHQTSNSSEDIEHQNDPGKNIKAALFTSDWSDDSPPFESSQSSEETESQLKRRRYSNLFSPDSERSTPSSLDNSNSSITDCSGNNIVNTHLDTIVEEDEESSSVCEKSVIMSMRQDTDSTINNVEPKQEVIETEEPEQEEEEQVTEEEEEEEAEEAENEILSSQSSEVEDLNMGLLDFSEMAQDFWCKEFVDEQTINYFIRLHDIRRQFYLTSNKEEGRFVVQELKGLKELTTSILTLTEMSEKLRQNPIWFQRRIWIDTRGFDLFSSDIQNREFFSLIKKSITHFSLGRRLTSYSELNDVQFLGFVYEELSSHLECLSIYDDVLTSWEHVFVPFSVCAFPKLKTIRFYSSQNNFTTQFIDQLLKTAPNLTSVYGLPLKYIRLLARKVRVNNSTGKNLVKSLNLDFSPYYKNVVDYEEDLSVLLKLKSCGLEEFQIPLFYPEPQQENNIKSKNDKKEFPLETFNYTELLQFNQHSIKKLILKSQKKIRSLDWPILNSCESLEFHVYLRKTQKNITPFFSKGFNVPARFPSLNNVEINFLDEDSPLENRKSKGRHPPLVHFKKYFPIEVFTPGSVFNSVVHLKLTNSIPVDCMEKLKSLFPNLKILTLHCNPSKLSEILPKVYNLWPQLEKLHLELTHENISSSFVLDPVFTGFNQLKCDSLRKLANVQNGESQEIENATNPLKMKDLKLLKFTFVMPEETSDDNKISALFSDVSFRFALGKHLMPQLKILIFFDESCTLTYKNEIIETLKPIREHVTIDGEM